MPPSPRAPLLCSLLVVPLMSLCLLACQPEQERAERARDEAIQALSRGDREAALREIETLRELEPDTPEATMELALLFVQAGEAPQALRILEDALQTWPESDKLRLAVADVALLVFDSRTALAALAPIDSESRQHAMALVLRAQAHLRLGDFERAVATLAEAEERYPDQPEARITRIGALLNERRFVEARQALDEATAALDDPEAEEALRGLEIQLHLAQFQDEPDAAVSALRGLAEAYPEDPRTWLALTQAMTQTGNAEEALALLRGAIEEDPDRLYLYAPLASLLRASGQADEGRDTLRTFTERSPSPTAFLALAQYHALDEDTDATRAALRDGLSAFPDDPLLLRALAETELSSADVATARRAVDRYRDAHPDDPSSEYLLARLELAEGEAAAASQRLTRLMPRLDQSFTQYWLGRALEAQDDFDAAERRYQLAVVRDPSDPALVAPLVRLAERRGDWRGVSRFGERLVNLAPGRFDGWSAWGTGLIALGDGARAEVVASNAVERFPDIPEAHLLHARALRTAGKYDESLAALEAASTRFDEAELDAERVLTLGLAGRLDEGVEVAHAADGDDASVQAALASLLFAAGRGDEGSRATDRALQLDPDDPSPWAARARFLASRGRFEDARRDCERYLAVRPDDAAMQFVLGASLEGAGRGDEAIVAYRRAAELDPEAFAPRNNLANLLGDRDLDAAIETAQEAYALRPKDVAVLDTLGWLYLRKGLVTRATALLEEAHAAAPGIAEVQLHLALAHREAGEVERARNLLEALRDRSDTPEPVGVQVRDALASLP